MMENTLGSQPRWRRQLLLAIGIMVGLAVMAIIHANWSTDDEPPPDPVRQAAWEKITPHLAAAEQNSASAADKYAKRVQEFFAERKKGARAFAEEALSWSGKWSFMMSKMPWAGEGDYNQFLRETFEQHVFKEEDLASLIKAAVGGYASELAGIENETLLAIRADLSDSDLARQEQLPALQSDDAFRRSYAAMMESVLPIVTKDAAVTAGREIASFVALDIATTIALDILATVGAQLGIEGGILGSGVASGAATLGIGLVAAILADMALDWVMKQAGYDPAGEIAAKVFQSLDTVETLLLNGDHTGKGGLCRELAKLREQRSTLRREALKKLVLEGGLE
jgi:hypothetical protein